MKSDKISLGLIALLGAAALVCGCNIWMLKNRMDASVLNTTPAVINSLIPKTLGLADLLPNDQSKIVIDSSVTALNQGITDIWFENEIDSVANIVPILKILDNATKNDIIRFHLAGIGGTVETVFDLINHIRSSDAKVLMIVEAPVYSAHAYLAVSSGLLIMKPLSSLMFHQSSAMNIDCTKETGTDRSISAIESCQNYKTNDLKLMHELIESESILTQKEKNAIETGHEVYITATEYNQRVKK